MTSAHGGGGGDDFPHIFHQLDDPDFFFQFVKAQYEKAPVIIAGVMRCEQSLSDDLIRYAYGEYQQNLSKFKLLLHSANPDHHKRAGALLHSLAGSEIITEIRLESSSEELESGLTRVQNADARYILPYVQFYEVFYNQITAFDLAFRVCAIYEEGDRHYDLDYMRNVSRYLYYESKAGLSVDTCFMLFKSLMADGIKS
jgi:hypothetical protein